MTTVANDQLLFIHIPKTGGTWVAEAMAAAGVSVKPFGEGAHPMLRNMPPRGDRFTFAFVREPVSWYRSMWNFHRRAPQIHWPNINRWIDLDLPDFLFQMAAEHPGYLANLYQQFVGTPRDPIDFVGHHEQLQDDLVQALHLAGQDFDEEVLQAFPARNFDNERELYGTLAPSHLIQTVPESIKTRIAHSERTVYERFYGIKAQSQSAALPRC